MNLFRYISLALAALAVTACDSNDTIPAPPPPPETFALQVLHGSADAPAVNVLANGNAVLSDVDNKAGSSQLTLETGNYSIQVDGLTPAGAATVIGPVAIDFAADTIYAIAAVGKVGDASLEPVVLSQPRTAVAACSARAFVLHGASDAPPVDVFVTTPGADLTTTAPLGSFAFKETLGPVEVASGDYQIRVTLVGDPATVVNDSGTLTLNAGDDLL
ncbi:MAG: DUF4397 domain-containing protein, partial [Woeseia sp.]